MSASRIFSLILCRACTFIMILATSYYVAALPGATHSRKVQASPSLSRSPAMSAGRVQYRLPHSLLMPRIPDDQYQTYINELSNSLERLGHSPTRVVPLSLNFMGLLNIQAIIRAQMAQNESKKQFIPILSDKRFFGLGMPAKVYGMPLIGDEYASQGIRDYAGRSGKQKVAIIGTVLSPGASIGPPVVELYGVADVSGAPKLHRSLVKPPLQSSAVHSLKQFLDLDEIAPGTPEVPRKVDAVVEHVIPIL